MEIRHRGFTIFKPVIGFFFFLRLFFPVLVLALIPVILYLVPLTRYSETKSTNKFHGQFFGEGLGEKE